MPILQHNARQICYASYGNAEAPCVLLIAGASSQLIRWHPSFIDSLVQLGLRVLTFDHRDVGLSQYYDHFGTPPLAAFLNSSRNELLIPPYTLHDMANDVIALLDGLQIRAAHIVGISMGGLIAQLLALTVPARVLSLSLLSSTSQDRHLPPPHPDIIAYFQRSLPRDATREDIIARQMELSELYSYPGTFIAIEAKRVATESFVRAYHPEGSYRHLLAVVAAAPRGADLPLITAPTLIVHGHHDPLWPVAHAEQMHQLISGSRLHVIDGIAHQWHPQIADAVRDFLADMTRTA